MEPTPVTIDNFFLATVGTFERIEKIPEGFIQFFKSKGSVYYTNEAKDTLVRASDHWGSGIRYCNWYIKGIDPFPSMWWQKNMGKRKVIGIIKYADMVDIRGAADFKHKIKRVRKEPESRWPIDYPEPKATSKKFKVAPLVEKVSNSTEYNFPKSPGHLPPKPKVNDAGHDLVVELYNEIAVNHYKNLSFTMFKGYFDKFFEEKTSGYVLIEHVVKKS